MLSGLSCCVIHPMSVAAARHTAGLLLPQTSQGQAAIAPDRSDASVGAPTAGYKDAEVAWAGSRPSTQNRKPQGGRIPSGLWPSSPHKPQGGCLLQGLPSYLGVQFQLLSLHTGHPLLVESLPAPHRDGQRWVSTSHQEPLEGRYQ